MDSHGIHVMTIANSIIGVSIIAMPYCFKQCGIILSIIMLIVSSIISRLSCHFLLKSAIRARLRTFEFLAYHAFGPFGKFIVEIGMIGFLLGTCIAFFVVMGDLGPEIVAQMIGTTNTDTLRSGILISLAVFCVLPLGLLRNVDSLSGVSVATIGFYVCLVLKIMAESASHIVTGDWYNKVDLWKTEGALQCTPIFSIALFCQTQLFEIYQAIPNASLEKMNALIRIAVNSCTCVYVFVGVFGYIALSDQNFTGNVLLSLRPSFLTEIIKIGFVLSLAFSFPLIIFPCRASLFSLIYKPTYTMLHDGGTHFIPETKFRTITIFIIAISLSIGILIPNIELVLGLVGSTIGVSICVLFPATCFICMVKKNTNERILAQIMLCIGIIVMVLGTYANLNVVDEITLGSISERPALKPVISINVEEKIVFDISTTGKLDIPNLKIDKFEDNIIHEDVIKERRHEPPQPIAPVQQSKQIETKEIKPVPVIPVQSELQQKEPELKEIRHEPPQPIEPEHNINQIKQDESQANDPEKNVNVEVLKVNIAQNNTSLAKQSREKPSDRNVINDQVDAEAIKKEEKEINQQAQEDLKNVVEKLDLISELQKQNQVQQQHIVEQQQKIWEEMKQRNDIVQSQMKIDKVKEEKLKAMMEIQDIAQKAIERLADDDPKVLLESKIIPNQNDKSKLENLSGNLSIQTLSNVKANPEPLSYQLGLKVENKTKSNKSTVDAFVPLPIIKSNMLANISSNNASYNVYNTNPTILTVKNDTSIISLKNASIQQNKVEKKYIQNHNEPNTTSSISNPVNENLNKVNAENSDLQDIKSMRRDILSKNESNIRSKRDLFDVNSDSQINVQCDQNKSEEDVVFNKENKANILLDNLKLTNLDENTENKEENCDKI